VAEVKLDIIEVLGATRQFSLIHQEIMANQIQRSMMVQRPS